MDIALLKRLNILNQLKDDSIVLNKTCQMSFTKLLYGITSDSAYFGKRPKDKRQAPTADTLNGHAATKWESILHFMVGSEFDVKLTKNVLEILNAADLMAAGADRSLSITNKGFQFLLADLSSQIWTLLLQYVELSEKLQMDIVDVLGFFLFISTLEVGHAYSIEDFTRTQMVLLKDLRDLGLVYQDPAAQDRFYPTILISYMGSNRSKAQNTTSTQIKDSFVLLETNYRVYAYTNSPLQIAILALFVQIKVQFPNLVVGLITRDSVRSALQKGITASQIVHYLNTHSHRQMNRGSVSPILLPQTVVDQINLWEIEMNRLKLTQSFLYKNFHSEKEFILAAKYAKDLNFLLWESTDPKNRIIIVSAEGHEIVKQYVKNLIAERQR